MAEDRQRLGTRTSAANVRNVGESCFPPQRRLMATIGCCG